MMCGLCLPRCPTYRLFGIESESPRGRIALMGALAGGKLPPTAQLKRHLEHCLMCRACEASCPAGVPFGKLMETARELLRSGEPQPKPAGNLELLRRLSPALRLYQLSGIQKVARGARLPRLLGLDELERLLPRSSYRPRLREHYPATGERKGTVGLFTGCVVPLLDGETLTSSIRLLTRLGYDVAIPRGQGCCGALQRHAGRADLAYREALDNLAAFPLDELDAVVYVTSGCGPELLEYERMTGLSPARRQRAAMMSSKVMEISRFLAGIDWPRGLRPAPLEHTVALHTPCSQRWISPKGDPSRDILERVPHLEVVPLPASRHCCGAAGEYMLRHPEIAARLLEPYLEDLQRLQPRFLVSSNIGCSLHIGAALREAGSTLELLHPVTLLARQTGAA